MTESNRPTSAADVLQAAVANSGFLSDLDEGGVAAVLERAHEVEVPEGDALTVEGEAGDAFFIVQAGRVRVTVDKAGEVTEVAVLGPGAVVGEISMLSDRPRTATCTVIDGPGAVLRVSRDDLAEVLAQRSDIAEKLRRIATTRAQETMRRLYS